MSMITDSDRMEWLAKNCYYLEYGNRKSTNEWWSEDRQWDDDEDSFNNPISLRDYIDLQLLK